MKDLIKGAVGLGLTMVVLYCLLMDTLLAIDEQLSRREVDMPAGQRAEVVARWGQP